MGEVIMLAEYPLWRDVTQHTDDRLCACRQCRKHKGDTLKVPVAAGSVAAQFTSPSCSDSILPTYQFFELIQYASGGNIWYKYKLSQGGE